MQNLADFLKRAKPRWYRAALDVIVWGWGRIALAIGLFLWRPCPLTFLLAFLLIASGMGILVALSHEAQHSALLRSRRWNNLAGAWLCAYPVGSIYGTSRAVHLAHHKYLNTNLDPDRHFHVEDDKSSPGRFALYFLKLLAGGQLYTSIIVNGFLRGRQSARSPADNVVVLPRRRYPEILNLALVQAIIFACLWLISGWWWLYFALWVAPVVTWGTCLGYLRGFIDHARLADDDPERSGERLVSVPRPALLDRLFLTGLDFHFHAEHHFFPSVPHYYLPGLHEILQADPQWRARYLVRRSYVSFLADYWRQICRGKRSRSTERMVDQPGRIKCGKPKVLFIQAKLPPSFWGMEYAAPYGGFRYPNPPLGLLTLAGAISPDYEVELRDENVGEVAHPTDADVVGISGTLLHVFHVNRVIELARYFKSQGKVVCVGGPVANLAPDTVRPYCDVLFEGEGEYTWPRFLKDYQNGDFRDTYSQVDKISMDDSPLPRIDLIDARNYAAGQIQTTRGCPFTCEFCDIIVMYGRKVRCKPIGKVLREVELWAEAGQQLIFFSDDNFVGNRPYCKELLRKLVEFNSRRRHPISFYTQASIDTARDPELMELLRDANFAGVFIGIESPRQSALAEASKVQNVHTEDLAEAVHTIQSYGLFVSGGMIVGFDHDDPRIFDEQYDFLQRAGVVFAQLSLLEAMPRTPLWERMKQAGRLLEYREGLYTNIMPLNMTYEQLVNGYADLIRRVYSYDSYAARYLTSLSYMRGYTFPHDRPAPRLQNLVSLARTLGYYLCPTDPGRVRFLVKMIWGTLRLQPRAWRWTMRYLCNYIHFSRFARVNVMVVLAPMTGQPAPAARAS